MSDQKHPEIPGEAWEQVGDPAVSVVRKAGQSLAARRDQDNEPKAGEKKQAAER